MSDDVLDFASLMCSRLCHDLLSPVGSFGNGLELLRDEQDEAMRESCVSLLEASSTTAIAKLKFFRLAFGSSGGYGDDIAVSDILDALRGLVPGTRTVQIGWIGEQTAVAKPAARVILALGLSLVEALIRGGRIDIAMEQRGELVELALRGEGDRIILDAASRAFFSDPGAELSPKTIGLALARRIALAGGGDIMLSHPGETELVIGAVMRA